MLSKQRQRKGKPSFLFLTLSTLIVLTAGLLTLLVQQRENSRADAGYVVGPPSLSAAMVNQIFVRNASPMMGMGAVVEQAARSNNVDDAFALAVWWAETNDGAAGVGFADRNPGSVRGSAYYPAAFDGYTIYPSYAAAINDWFALLRNRYVNQGLTSVYAISGPYVGTSGAPSWAAKVVNLMLRYRGQAPAPIAAAPTVAPTAPIAAAAPIPQKSAPPLFGGTGGSKKQAHGNGDAPVEKVQHRPVKVGEGSIQNLIQGSGHVIKSKPGKSSAPRQADEIFTTHIQQLLIFLVLLAICLVLLPIIHLKHRSAARNVILADGDGAMRTTSGLLATDSLAPLYVNEYSPSGRVQKSSTRETGELQHERVGTGMPEVPVTPILSTASMVPLTPFVGGSEGRRGEAALRRARLVPVVEVSTEVINVKQLSSSVKRARQYGQYGPSERIGERGTA